MEDPPKWLHGWFGMEHLMNMIENAWFTEFTGYMDGPPIYFMWSMDLSASTDDDYNYGNEYNGRSRGFSSYPKAVPMNGP